MTDNEMAQAYVKKNCDDSLYSFRGQELKEAFLAGLKAQKEKMKAVNKTSYIKGIRTMANALKEYDRTEGAWTDYFEHKVDETLKMLLKKGVIKENLTTVAECETQELLDKQIEAKELLKFWVNDFYDNSNSVSKYEKRHKALAETESFLKEEI